MNKESLLESIVKLVKYEHQQGIRELIEREVELYASGIDSRALNFLEDLNFFVRMRGPDFMYSRGIAGSLQVSEDIFELAYAVKQKMP